jgi:hypothetical protein
LQRFADQTGLTLHVCPLPPGTSRWNKIEHCTFSFISQNGRGRPLLTRATIVNLIVRTQTQTGLSVRCVLDRRPCPKEVKIRDEQMQRMRLKPEPFHGEWNYAIRPR